MKQTHVLGEAQKVADENAGFLTEEPTQHSTAQHNTTQHNTPDGLKATL